MNENLYRGDLEKHVLQDLLKLLFTPERGRAYALLEVVPSHFMEEKQLARGLQLICFHEGLDPGEWTEGKIFNIEGELRWQKGDNTFHVIYAGSSPHAASFLESETLDWESSFLEGYYLWGERLSLENKSKMGLDPEKGLFLELQIPCAFAYPVEPEGLKRCKVNIVRYNDRASGIPQYFRMHSLQEVE